MPDDHSVRDLALLLLDLLEQKESRLLSWGIVEGAFTNGELREAAERVLTEGGAIGAHSADELIGYLLERVLVWEVPMTSGESTYRTRSAEAIRLASRLKQMFKPSQWRFAPDLVSDFRYHRQPRRFPIRSVPAAEVTSRLDQAVPLTPRQRQVLQASLGGVLLSEFQYEACESVLCGVANSKLGATLVSAGTGSGKTLAFLLPSLLTLAEVPQNSRSSHVLAIYPRNELLKDQMRAALAFFTASQDAMSKVRGRPVSIGAYFGSVPQDASDALRGGYRRWDRVPLSGGAPGLRCPFLDCPKCGGPLLWPLEDAEAGSELLKCSADSCGVEFGPNEVRLTREALKSDPPDVLFSSTEMLNRALSDSGFAPLFGVGTNEGPSVVALDEVHTYQGTHGAQVGLLLRRWRHLSYSRSHFIGLSATIVDGSRFMQDLTGVFEANVRVIEPDESQMIKKGADYTLVLRANSTTRTSLLSTTIQASLLFTRILDSNTAVADKVSKGIVGTKSFLFTDNLDVTNRLYDSLNDAEGWWSGGRPNRNAEGSLANLRGDQHPDADERYEAGQGWRICQSIGHSLASGHRTPGIVGRTSSQDQGVDAGAREIVATASLEVGFDDPEVGLVLQHKAPNGAAVYLQRRGRAGRTQDMRPWTVIVLSDFGRDRRAYENFEDLFAPRLSARYLPIRNPYVLRIQATFALVDWLSTRVPRGLGGQLRYALSAPVNRADVVAPIVQLLRSLLDDPSVRREFRQHVKDSLELEDEYTLDRILWGAPRSLLVEVVPTLLRRLETGWHDEYYRPHDPLPEFLPRALFEELNLPELEIHVPGRDEPTRMGLRQGISEFALGKVSRRFATEHAIEAHWLEPPEPDQGTVEVGSTLDGGSAVPLGAYPDETGRSVQVFLPLHLKLKAVPGEVLPTSNARLGWASSFSRSSDGRSLPTPEQGQSELGLIDAHALVHSTGDFVEVTRFATHVDITTIWRNGTREERTVEFRADGSPAAIGFSLEVDGLCFRVRLPDGLHELVQSNPALIRTLRVERFRSLLLDDPLLSELANRFSIAWLVDAALSAVAKATLVQEPEPGPVVGEDSCFSAHQLLAALKTVFGVRQREGDGEEEDGAHDDSVDSQELSSKKLQELESLLHESGVMEAISSAARSLVEPFSQDWDEWIAERAQDTASALFLQACERSAPDAAGESLMADVVLSSTEGPGEFEVWITESTPGGAGAIQRIAQAIGEDDQSFFSLVSAGLEPSDRELATDSFLSVLGLVSDTSSNADADLQYLIDRVRSAGSHDEAVAAFSEFSTELKHCGVLLHPSILTAVNLRLLKPGSSQASDRLQYQLSEQWAHSEAELGFALPPRVFGELASHSSTYDADLRSVFQLSGQLSPEVRYQHFIPLLWSSPAQLRTEALESYNPYRDFGYRDRTLWKALYSSATPVINLTDPDWREQLTTALGNTGYVDLQCPGATPEDLRTSILDLFALPVDAGVALGHVRVRGYSRTGTYDQIRVELPEAYR